MTPQERQLIDDLFDRLARLENAPRDPEAMSAIMQGLRKAPNAVYALVQTTLVQDEALKHADSRIQELEAAAGQQNQPAGFLDSMRDAIFGQSQQQGQGQSQGSVPNVRAPGISGSRPAWNTGQVLQQGQPGGQYGQPAYAQPSYGAQQPQQQSPFGGGGGSFLGTAAAAAVGVVGGSMLASSLRSMMGGSSNQQSFGDTAGHSGGIEDRRPWSDQSGGNLARDAGVNDIGSSGQRADNNDSGSRQGFFDQASHDEDDDMDHDADGFDGDSDGDGDYA